MTTNDLLHEAQVIANEPVELRFAPTLFGTRVSVSSLIRRASAEKTVSASLTEIAASNLDLLRMAVHEVCDKISRTPFRLDILNSWADYWFLPTMDRITVFKKSNGDRVSEWYVDPGDFNRLGFLCLINTLPYEQGYEFYEKFVVKWKEYVTAKLYPRNAT